MTRSRFFRRRYILPLAAAGIFVVGSSFKDDFFEIAKQLEIFTEVYKAVNMNYVDETNPGELMDKATKSMLADLDPYTNYYNEQDVLRYKINNTGEYTGIGALMTRKDGHLIVREPYKGNAADKAGLKAGDEIVKVNDIDVVDFKDDGAQLFRGGKNTKFNITYIRQGKTATTQLVLGEESTKAVPYFAKIDEKTGYIALSQFTRTASSEVREALESLKSQGAERIVLDLRGNPGGLLQEAVAICGLFVPKNEVIVTTKSKVEKHNNTYRTTKEPIDTNIPLAVLVDGKSASASEIVSGALQDLDRAVIIGTRSFGKGLVQRPMDLVYGAQVKVTISRYYTPSGRCIQALDYRHRDVDGKAVRTDATKYNAFKTRKGRTVYDGGGIQPDVEVANGQQSAIVEALQKNDGVFDYATKYYYAKPNPGEAIPVLSDADYADFRQFVKAKKLQYKTETEVQLRQALETAKKEKLDDAISASYNQLIAALEKGQDDQLSKFQKEIRSLILDELIKRYHYKEGLYKYYTTANPEIKKATELLANSAEYNKILKN